MDAETNIYQVLTSSVFLRHLLEDDKGDIASWEAWLTVCKIIEGLPLETDKERALYSTLSGNTEAYKPHFKERIFLCKGRRSGKSKFVSLLAGAIALMSIEGTVQKKLSAGEQAVIGICSPSKKQSALIGKYLEGAFQSNDFLLSLVKDQKFTAEGFELKNNIVVSILTGNWRSIRGHSMIAAIIDELCFFLADETGHVLTDKDLLEAVEPSLASLDGRLICLSSPHAPTGEMWNVYSEHYAKNIIEDETVFLKGPSLLMNPTLKKATVQKAYDRDAVVAASEWGASFRESIGGYVNSKTLEKVIIKDRTELHFNSFNRYKAFSDLSSLVSENSDDAAVAIGYVKKSLTGGNDKLIIARYLHFRGPCSLEYAVKKMAELLKEYGIRSVHADDYASEFQSRLWKKNHIKHIKIRRSKTQLYTDLLGMFSSGTIELLDDPEMKKQLLNLQRKAIGGGAERIDHVSGSDDAIANCCGGLASISLKPVLKLGAYSFNDRESGVDAIEKIFNQN